MTNKKNTFFKRYHELLLDEKFIQWRLLPDEGLEEYWKSLQDEFPNLKNEITLADNYIIKTQFKKSKLKLINKQLLLHKIRQTLKQNNNSHQLKVWTRYGVVASIVILISVTLFFLKPFSSTPIEIISGNILDSEDIQLISNNETKTFSENISIKIGTDGVAKINEPNKEEQDLNITKSRMNKLIVPYGKRSSIELSDGTKITLNSGSSLEFPSSFDNDTRKVVLVAGEAFIEVAPDTKRPFYLDAANFRINVLGTTFNISSYENYPQSVVLVEGKVSLETADKKNINLQPNQMAIYTDQGDFETKTVDVNKYISWKNGYLEFDEISVKEVLSYIERYYNLSFNYDKETTLRNTTCRGKLYLSENVDNVMNAIAISSSTIYKREGDIINITNKPYK